MQLPPRQQQGQQGQRQHPTHSEQQQKVWATPGRVAVGAIGLVLPRLVGLAQAEGAQVGGLLHGPGRGSLQRRGRAATPPRLVSPTGLQQQWQGRGWGALAQSPAACDGSPGAVHCRCCRVWQQARMMSGSRLGEAGSACLWGTHLNTLGACRSMPRAPKMLSAQRMPACARSAGVPMHCSWQRGQGSGFSMRTWAPGTWGAWGLRARWGAASGCAWLPGQPQRLCRPAASSPGCWQGTPGTRLHSRGVQVRAQPWSASLFTRRAGICCRLARAAARDLQGWKLRARLGTSGHGASFAACWLDPHAPAVCRGT